MILFTNMTIPDIIYHDKFNTKLHQLGVKLLEWSAKSPYLNIIEHLWSIIDDKLKSKPLPSVKELTGALSIEWLPIKPDIM